MIRRTLEKDPSQHCAGATELADAIAGARAAFGAARHAGDGPESKRAESIWQPPSEPIDLAVLPDHTIRRGPSPDAPTAMTFLASAAAEELPGEALPRSAVLPIIPEAWATFPK